MAGAGSVVDDSVVVGRIEIHAHPRVAGIVAGNGIVVGRVEVNAVVGVFADSIV